MRIVLTVSAMGSGGAERVVSLLSDEFCKLGHEVTILMISTSEKKSFYSLNPNVNLVPLLSGVKKRTRFLSRVRIMRKNFLEVRPDIVISFLNHVCIYTYFALRNTTIPYILSERNDPNQYSFLYRQLLKRAFSNASGCVFQTNDAMKWYRKKRVKATDRVIYNPVNLSFIPENLTDVKRKKNVLFVGRLVKQKNIALLLNSFKLFSMHHDDYFLDVYGDGPEKHDFFKQAKELGIENKIIYHGIKADWHGIEYNSSLFVLTSLFEGMPNSLLEAASLNIPCLSTDCPIGGSRELSSIFDNILLVENNCTPEQFYYKMEEAILYNKPFQGIKKEMQLSSISNNWIDLFEDVINAKKHNCLSFR